MSTEEVEVDHQQNVSISINGQSKVPPGFRFHPTEEELLQYYLRKKVGSHKIDLDVIVEVDLNKLEPWDIQEKCKIGSTPQNEWYFFSHKDKKYPTGTRTNRATMAGFWKATGRDKVIYGSGRRIGMRKTLVFYKGRAPHGQKSDWIMHEYRLIEDYCNNNNNNSRSNNNIIVTAGGVGDNSEEGWVVCKIFKKKHFPNKVSSSSSGGRIISSSNNNHQLHHCITNSDQLTESSYMSSDHELDNNNHQHQHLEDGALEQMFQHIAAPPSSKFQNGIIPIDHDQSVVFNNNDNNQEDDSNNDDNQLIVVNAAGCGGGGGFMSSSSCTTKSTFLDDNFTTTNSCCNMKLPSLLESPIPNHGNDNSNAAYDTLTTTNNNYHHHLVCCDLGNKDAAAHNHLVDDFDDGLSDWGTIDQLLANNLIAGGNNHHFNHQIKQHQQQHHQLHDMVRSTSSSFTSSSSTSTYFMQPGGTTTTTTPTPHHHDSSFLVNNNEIDHLWNLVSRSNNNSNPLMAPSSSDHHHLLM